MKKKEKISGKVPQTVDAELEEKMVMERIRSLQHEKKLMTERKGNG